MIQNGMHCENADDVLTAEKSSWTLFHSVGTEFLALLGVTSGATRLCCSLCFAEGLARLARPRLHCACQLKAECLNWFDISSCVCGGCFAAWQWLEVSLTNLPFPFCVRFQTLLT